jgi:hypothetical protein
VLHDLVQLRRQRTVRQESTIERRFRRSETGLICVVERWYYAMVVAAADRCIAEYDSSKWIDIDRSGQHSLYILKTKEKPGCCATRLDRVAPLYLTQRFMPSYHVDHTAQATLQRVTRVRSNSA